MRTTISLLALGAMMASLATTQALSVVGSWSNLTLNQQYEEPFWTETLPAAVPRLEVESRPTPR